MAANQCRRCCRYTYNTRVESSAGTSRAERTHTRLRTLTHAYARTLTHACLHMNAYARTLTYVCTLTHAYARTHARTLTHAHACKLAHARLRTHARSRTHAYVYARLRTLTHAYARTITHAHARSVWDRSIGFAYELYRAGAGSHEAQMVDPFRHGSASLRRDRRAPVGLACRPVPQRSPLAIAVAPVGLWANRFQPMQCAHPVRELPPPCAGRAGPGPPCGTSFTGLVRSLVLTERASHRCCGAWNESG
jgi:hypothetical protein